jgi:hypothetical protein
MKREIILIPVISLTDNEEYTYLKGTIYNVLLINLKKQESLNVLNEHPGVITIIKQSCDFEAYLNMLHYSFPKATAIITEYYVADEMLHMLINVWDLSTLRVKNSFINTMPADLDMLKNIEKMAASTAVAVARELPPTERDAVFEKQVVASLRQKINDEERLVEDIFSLQHEIAIVPFAGISLGRTVLSWSPLGPFFSPSINLEYSYFLESPFHLRFGLEYLFFDLLALDSLQHEFSIDAYIGVHTESIFSFSLDVGLALIYDYNPASAALAYKEGSTTVTPEAERFSLSLPLQLGLTMYFSKNMFISFRLKYHGLTLTFESLDPESYDVGNKRLKYYYGFSPWNFLCITLLVQSGFRF